MAGVSFPVAVFWFDGWYDASNVTPFGIVYCLACPNAKPALLVSSPVRFP